MGCSYVVLLLSDFSLLDEAVTASPFPPRPWVAWQCTSWSGAAWPVFWSWVLIKRVWKIVVNALWHIVQLYGLSPDWFLPSVWGSAGIFTKYDSGRSVIFQETKKTILGFIYWLTMKCDEHQIKGMIKDHQMVLMKMWKISTGFQKNWKNGQNLTN